MWCQSAYKVPKVLHIGLLCVIQAITCCRTFEPDFKPYGELQKEIDSIPQYARFSFAGLAFFKGKLFVSTNIGLLEIEHQRIRGLYQWNELDRSLSGPWIDNAHDALWCQELAYGSFIRLTKNGWAGVRGPMAKDQTREESFIEPRAMANKKNFWMLTSRNFSKWNESGLSWDTEKVPSGVKIVAAGAAFEESLILVSHESSSIDRIAPDVRQPASDRAFYFSNGLWTELCNFAGPFITKDVVSGRDDAFVLTVAGVLLKMNRTAITKVDILGKCEAISSTEKGDLLCSIVDKGVYLNHDGWKKVFDCPYAHDGGHDAFLTESAGKVAFAVSPQSRLVDMMTNKRSFTGSAQIWIWHNQSLVRIQIGER